VSLLPNTWLLFCLYSSQAPSSETQDKVAFIINNISWTNLEAKAKECVEILKEEYYPWFAQYIVMKR
jgi:CCR4-NOT transcription complex subunit 1